MPVSGSGWKEVACRFYPWTPTNLSGGDVAWAVVRGGEAPRTYTAVGPTLCTGTALETTSGILSGLLFWPGWLQCPSLGILNAVFCKKRTIFRNLSGNLNLLDESRVLIYCSSCAPPEDIWDTTTLISPEVELLCKQNVIICNQNEFTD